MRDFLFLEMMFFRACHRLRCAAPLSGCSLVVLAALWATASILHAGVSTVNNQST